MIHQHAHIISLNSIARKALLQLDKLPNLESRTLFVVDENDRLAGSLTDGDIRRGLLAGFEISDSLAQYMNPNCKFITEEEAVKPEVIRQFRKKGIQLLPVVNQEKRIIKIVDFNEINTILPISALLMAGGRGERLKPLTDNTPKPMLRVGEKPILEINIDRLIRYGVDDFYISIRYLGNQIKEYFGDGSAKGVKIHYIEENEPLGTIGALHSIHCKHPDILVMNADVLTNIDFEDFYDQFNRTAAQMMVASVPYHVRIPYGIMQLNDEGGIHSLIEKPTYSYYSNAGIYLLKSELKQKIPAGHPYNATDLMEVLIQENQPVKHFPILNYWLDIGRQEDFVKAQTDIRHLSL